MSSRDLIMYDCGQNERQYALYQWAMNVLPHPVYAPDPHRLQLERWIWDQRDELGEVVMDVGPEGAPREWIGDGYFTFGLHNAEVIGNLLNLPFENALDGVLCTEVLEHCADPFRALREIHNALKPGGVLLASAPFCWPDHRTDAYPDYWRFTEQAWELMLRDFSSVEIKECEWSDEGAMLYDLMRRFEGFGFRRDTKMTTGYLVKAVK